MNVLRKFIRSERGAVAILAAITIVPVTMAAVGGLDFMTLLDKRGAYQAEVDAAALDGARVFIEHFEQPEHEVDKQIVARVKNRLEALADRDPSALFTYDYSYDIEERVVTIDASVVTQTSILSMIGLDQLSAGISSKAEAKIESQPVCILALSNSYETGIEFEGDGEMKAKGCVVWSNSRGAQSIRFDGNGKVETERLCTAGRASNPGRFKIKPAPQEYCDAVEDPLSGWTPPNKGDCDYGSLSSGDDDDDDDDDDDNWIRRTTAQLSPGTYCGGLRVDAKNIIMKPGVYVVRNGPLILRGSSKIKGKGIGIFLTGPGARLDIDGKAKVEISAPTDGRMAGIAIASDRLTTGEQSSLIAGRADLKIGGVVYLPKHHMTYWGESDTRAASPVTTLIAERITIGGDAYLEVKNDKKKAKYAPVIETGKGAVRLVR